MTVRVFWEPRDLWIGVYWTKVPPKVYEAHGVHIKGPAELRVYVCLLPCLPILLTFRRMR